MAKSTTSKTSRTKPSASKTTKATTTKKTATKTTSAKITRSRSATSKTSTARAAAKTAPKSSPVVVKKTAPVVSAPDMKKIDLIDAVVERSGIKKKFAKPTIEAALAVLGEALADGRSLNLRPLGKVKIQRTKDVSNATVMTVRIRQPHEPKDNQAALADVAE